MTLRRRTLARVTDNRNRQDVREDGEIPSLPRNCERPCPADRQINREQDFSQSFSFSTKGPTSHWMPVNGRWEGG
jgi:hypothetical protein